VVISVFAAMAMALAADSPNELRLADRVSQVIVAPAPLRGSITQGGVLVTGPELGDLGQLQRSIGSWRRRAPEPIIVAADVELGLLHRLHGHPGLPAVPDHIHAAEAGDIETLGEQVGAVLKEVGIDLVFAPVLDLSSSGFMARTGRSVGDDPTRVAAVGKAYAAGLRRSGLLVVAKHYPGYGNAARSTDTHAVRAPPDTRANHAAVFAALAPHVDGFLLSNLAYGEDVPAPASRTVVTSAHRMTPVVFTDDVAAARRAWRDRHLVANAFTAGVDVIVTSAPRDWTAHVDEPVWGEETWALQDPAAELMTHLQAHPDAIPRLDESVCKIWDLAHRAGRRESPCI
jgi:beta-glucosidase-like glycosyl hydrolase